MSDPAFTIDEEGYRYAVRWSAAKRPRWLRSHIVRMRGHLGSLNTQALCGAPAPWRISFNVPLRNECLRCRSALEAGAR